MKSTHQQMHFLLSFKIYIKNHFDLRLALNTAHSTHTMRSHSTQRTVHIPYGHTQHSAQYTHHTYDMLPHHRITYNDVVFTES